MHEQKNPIYQKDVLVLFKKTNETNNKQTKKHNWLHLEILINALAFYEGGLAFFLLGGE